MAWWGHVDGVEVLVVAGRPATARSLTGLSASQFPYRLEPTTVPSEARKAGVYVKRDGAWTLRDPSKVGP